MFNSNCYSPKFKNIFLQKTYLQKKYFLSSVKLYKLETSLTLNINVIKNNRNVWLYKYAKTKRYVNIIYSFTLNMYTLENTVSFIAIELQ